MNFTGQDYASGMEKWFANKGQVVQVVAATLSGLAAVIGLIALIAAHYVIAYGVFTAIVCGWAIVSVAVFIRNRRTKPTVIQTVASLPSEFDKLADEDSRNMSKRLILCEKSAKLNIETVDPYVDVTFRLVNTSVFGVLADGVEGPAFYRGYSGEKCPLSHTPKIVDSLHVFSLPRGEMRNLTLRQFVPLSITDNIAANNDALPLYLNDVRVKFGFAGTTATRFEWFAEEVEVGGLSVSSCALAKLGIVPRTTFVSVNVVSVLPDERKIARGKNLKIRYVIESSEDASDKIWLGASVLTDKKTGKYFANTDQDKVISLVKGRHEYDRDLSVPMDAPLGIHTLRANVWRIIGDGKSMIIAKGMTNEIEVVQ